MTKTFFKSAIFTFALFFTLFSAYAVKNDNSTQVKRRIRTTIAAKQQFSAEKSSFNFNRTSNQINIREVQNKVNSKSADIVTDQVKAINQNKYTQLSEFKCQAKKSIAQSKDASFSQYALSFGKFQPDFNQLFGANRIYLQTKNFNSNLIQGKESHSVIGIQTLSPNLVAVSIDSSYFKNDYCKFEDNAYVKAFQLPSIKTDNIQNHVQYLNFNSIALADFSKSTLCLIPDSYNTMKIFSNAIIDNNAIMPYLCNKHYECLFQQDYAKIGNSLMLCDNTKVLDVNMAYKDIYIDKTINAEKIQLMLFANDQAYNSKWDISVKSIENSPNVENSLKFSKLSNFDIQKDKIQTIDRITFFNDIQINKALFSSGIFNQNEMIQLCNKNLNNYECLELQNNNFKLLTRNFDPSIEVNTSQLLSRNFDQYSMNNRFETNIEEFDQYAINNRFNTNIKEFDQCSMNDRFESLVKTFDQCSMNDRFKTLAKTFDQYSINNRFNTNIEEFDQCSMNNRFNTNIEEFEHECRPNKSEKLSKECYLTQEIYVYNQISHAICNNINVINDVKSSSLNVNEFFIKMPQAKTTIGFSPLYSNTYPARKTSKVDMSKKLYDEMFNAMECSMLYDVCNQIRENDKYGIIDIDLLNTYLDLYELKNDFQKNTEIINKKHKKIFLSFNKSMQ